MKQENTGTKRRNYVRNLCGTNGGKGSREENSSRYREKASAGRQENPAYGRRCYRARSALHIVNRTILGMSALKIGLNQRKILAEYDNIFMTHQSLQMV